jgi:DNA-binding transcriptional ArsR family regulator/uncharacterized protein YndB with AHSA1/START domain
MDDDLALAWKALADPTRRHILDYLKERPRTTGELSDLFAQSRFGVMKHLAILERAGLIVVRRRGRERWNHLNAIPLQRIYERWLRPYEAEWADRLLQLKRTAETPKGAGEMAEATVAPTTGLIQIEQEVTVNAAPEKVWDALINDVSAWWTASCMYDASRAKAMLLEARVGGRFYEDWGDGEGALFGIVTGLHRNQWLEVSGSIGMGMAIAGTISYTLEAQGDCTLLKFSHHASGAVSSRAQQLFGSGWTELLGSRLKNFVEHGVRSGFRD